MTSKKTLNRTKFIEHSAVFLPDNSPIFRKPRFGWKKREDNFLPNFEQKILFYDVFWQDNNGGDEPKILLIGPPPRNLMPALKKAKYSVDNNDTPLKAKFFISHSVMITELSGVTKNAKQLHINLNGLLLKQKIQPNLSKKLAQKNILFTMSKNNKLSWITAWADYHQHFHNVDSIILIDNGSSNATLKEIANSLEKTNIKDIIIISMPYIYGAIDTSVIANPYWTHFLQIAGLNLALRRFSAQANGLLNCDIDELIKHRSTTSIFDALKNTPKGLLSMRGSWVEANPINKLSGNHQDFAYRLKDEKARHCRPSKWVIDPKKDWVKKLNIHPYMHWIENRPLGSKFMTKDAFFWHFKGINNNWKVNRNITNKYLPDNIELDKELISTMSLWAEKQKQDKLK